MPKLVGRGRVLVVCGNTVYKVGKLLGIGGNFLHMDVRTVFGRVDKATAFPYVFTLVYTNLYTIFQQFYNITQSVTQLLIHTFHRPYKNIYDLYKGDY